MPGRLQGLENFDWSDFLQTSTWVLNDAVSAMMAEARFGAAKNKKNVVMLTLGTGVGGAILINGQPYQGAFHKAGHFGHMVINDEGEPDICGMPGSLEDAIGNITVSRRSGGKFNSTQNLLEAFHNGSGRHASRRQRGSGPCWPARRAPPWKCGAGASTSGRGARSRCLPRARCGGRGGQLASSSRRSWRRASP